MIHQRLVTHRCKITRPVLGTNAAGDTDVPTGAYASTGQDRVPCTAEQVSGDTDAEQARTPVRAVWRVTVDECVDVEELDRVELIRAGRPPVVATVTEVRRYPVPRRIAHLELTCRETTG